MLLSALPTILSVFSLLWILKKVDGSIKAFLREGYLSTSLIANRKVTKCVWYILTNPYTPWDKQSFWLSKRVLDDLLDLIKLWRKSVCLASMQLGKKTKYKKSIQVNNEASIMCFMIANKLNELERMLVYIDYSEVATSVHQGGHATWVNSSSEARGTNISFSFGS